MSAYRSTSPDLDKEVEDVVGLALDAAQARSSWREGMSNAEWLSHFRRYDLNIACLSDRVEALLRVAYAARRVAEAQDRIEKCRPDITTEMLDDVDAAFIDLHAALSIEKESRNVK